MLAKSHVSKVVHALSFAKKDFKCEFARVVKTPFEKALCRTSRLVLQSVHLFDPNTIDQSRVLPSLHCSCSSTDESSTAGISSGSAKTPVLSTSEKSPIQSVNPSPIVSSLFSHADDGYSSSQV